MKVRISPGNSKLGRITNVSLPPVISCRPGVPCANGGCYAIKAYRQYPNVRDAWNFNLAAWQHSPPLYFDSIISQLKTMNKREKYFRWHVAGDIQDEFYLRGMFLAALELPDWRFRAFTKQFDIVNDLMTRVDCPENLKFGLSAWPGLELENPHNLPIAYYDGQDPDIFTCTGSCAACKVCWHTSKDINLPAH